MILRASNAPIWANCHGSTALSVVEKGPTPESLEGDLCHLLAMLFATHIRSSLSVDEINAHPELISRNNTGLVVTEEYKDLALEASAFCLSKTDTGSMWETPMRGGSLPEGVEGTCDFMGYEKKTKTLHVVDLKFGFSSVQAVGNAQPLCYSQGARDILGGKIGTVALHIYQPRDYVNGAVKTWEMPLGTWLAHLDQLHKDAALARNQVEPTRTGPWCKHCKSRTNCGAWLDVASHALETIMIDPEDSPIAEGHLGAEYAYIKRAESIIVSARKAYEDLIMSRIESGNPVPGWMIGSTKGKRKWSASTEEIKATAQMFGLDLLREKPISIGDAWKNKAIRPMLETLVSKSEGSKKLVPFDAAKIKEKLTHD